MTDAIGRYALQLIALAHNDPEKHDAVVAALSPIDEFRAPTGRRVSDDDEEEEDGSDTLVTPLPANASVVLAPVA